MSTEAQSNESEIKTENSLASPNNNNESSSTNEQSNLISNIKMFKCCICKLFTKYDYFGTRPVERHVLNRLDKDNLSEEEQREKLKLLESIKNKKESIVLLEKCYVCDDPFSNLKSYNYLVLGGTCFTCSQMVCMSNECSVFYYKKRFCLKCAANHLETDKDEFPIELKKELIKIISQTKINE
jgi:hypothetical protein